MIETKDHTGRTYPPLKCEHEGCSARATRKARYRVKNRELKRDDLCISFFCNLHLRLWSDTYGIKAELSSVGAKDNQYFGSSRETVQGTP